MFEVIYYSLSGNTRKLAEAIAAELAVAAEDVKAKGGLAEDPFVFLGAGKDGPLRGWGHPLLTNMRLLQCRAGDRRSGPGRPS